MVGKFVFFVVYLSGHNVCQKLFSSSSFRYTFNVRENVVFLRRSKVK